MSQRIAYPTLFALAAIVASVLSGAATAKGVAAPTITSVSPASGPRGTVVTITGTNLQHASVTWGVAGNPGASGSTSGAMKATPLTATVSPDGTQIMFNVPDGGDASHGIMAPAGTNRITVTTPGGSVSKLFRVTTTNTLGLRPSITYLRPTHAARGAKVTIFGTHLTGATTVTLGGLKAGFTVPSDTRIVATVPMAARSGRWLVSTRFGSATSPSFTVGGAVEKSTAASALSATVVTVTAGKPSELAFKLSKTSKVPAGTITFKVTNEGVAYHDFRICTKPVASSSDVTNSCAGKTTPILHSGKSATLTVRITKTGLYEFLCTVAGHAAAGMKGLLGVGVAVTSSEQKAASKAGTPSGSNTGGTSTATETTTSTPVTTTAATTTTRSSSGGTTAGGSECPPGVTIQTSGNGDADGDELGTEPTDNDGCV